MEKQKAVQRDWTSFPPELLNLIARNLSEISDVVRFRAACTTWYFSDLITDLPPKFPWIQEGFKCGYVPNQRPRFYSIPSNKIHTLHVPKALNKKLFKQSEGYWFAELRDESQKRYELSLLNPLINDEITLPGPNFSRLSLIGHQQNQMREHGVWCEPYVPSDYWEVLVFCHVGQDNWNVLSWEKNNEECKHFYLKGMLFTIEAETGITKVRDITTSSLIYVIPPVKEYRPGLDVELVEASGDILRIHFGPFYSPERIVYKYWFHIHQMDVDDSGSRCWVKVESIGNHALFLDWNGCFVLSASDSCGIKANSIYLFKSKHRKYMRPLYEVERIDLETDAREYFPCPFDRIEGWFVPKLHRLGAL